MILVCDYPMKKVQPFVQLKPKYHFKIGNILGGENHV
jgi:hypothetical protein